MARMVLCKRLCNRYVLHVHVLLYVISIIPDELFGQCLTQQQERFRYRVTAGLLDRLQSLLQMLMKKGLSHPPICLWLLHPLCLALTLDS